MLYTSISLRKKTPAFYQSMGAPEISLAGVIKQSTVEHLVVLRLGNGDGGLPLSNHITRGRLRKRLMIWGGIEGKLYQIVGLVLIAIELSVKIELTEVRSVKILKEFAKCNYKLVWLFFRILILACRILRFYHIKKAYRFDV